MRLTEDWYIEHAGDVIKPAIGERDMKFKLVVAATMILLLASFSAHAKNSRPFYLRTAVTLNGAEVPADLYNLSWESRNSTVSVTLWKDGRFIATAQGIWVKHGVKYTEDAALLRVNSDGSRSLVEIRMAGIKKTIVLSSFDPILRLSAK
jgi:hypothetical protein